MSYIQGFMFHVISISAELKSFNYHSTVGLISLILCFFFSFGLFIFTALAVASFVDGYGNEHSEFHNHWSIHEFFSGIKKSKYAKFNSLCFLLVRFLSVLTIIMIGNATGRQRSEVSTKDHAVYHIKWSLFFVTYLSSTLYVLIVRPYESIVNNIIEGINQINFTLVIIPLVFLRFESDWSSTKEDIYMQSLLSGPMIGTLISIVPLIFLICNKCSSIRKKVHAKARTSTTMVKDLGNNENNQKMEGS